MGKKIMILLAFILLIASWAVTFLPAKAEDRTIIVPDDYPTISEAINNANIGDTIFVKKGTYNETQLIVSKPLSLIGEAPELTKINLDPPLLNMGEIISWIDGKPTTIWIHDLSIKVEADDFKFQGFAINTTGGSGVSITGNRTQLTDNIIITPTSLKTNYGNISANIFLGDVGINGSYSNIAENNFSGYISAFGSHLNISANNKNSSNKVGVMDSGIKVDGSFCVIYGNNITAKGLVPGIGVSGERNFVAKNIVDSSDVGIAVSGSNNILYANRITNCKDDSFVSGISPTSGVALRVSGNNTLYANYIAYNTWGADVNVHPETNLTSTLYHNNFVGNTYQVAALSRFRYGNDSFDNGVEGNFWSDYNGIDANSDGVGDVPYIIDDNRSDRYPLMAPFDIDSLTVKLPEWANTSTEKQAESNLAETEFDSTTLVIIAIAVTTVTLVGAGLIVYFKKRPFNKANLR